MNTEQQHPHQQPINNNYYFYQFVSPLFVLRDISDPSSLFTSNTTNNNASTQAQTNSNTSINQEQQQPQQPQQQPQPQFNTNSYPGQSRMSYSTTANAANANSNTDSNANATGNRRSSNDLFGNLIDLLFDNASSNINNQQQSQQSNTHMHSHEHGHGHEQSQQSQQSQSSNNFFFVDPLSLLFNQIFLQQQQQQQQGFQGQPPASKIAMESLKVVSPKSRLLKLQPTCSICMEDFCSENNTEGGEQNQRLRAMPCGHVYHEDCIFEWLRKSNTCANCRYEIETDNTDYNEGVKKRMADRHPVFAEHECALSQQGCCDFEDQNGEFFDEEEEEKHLTKVSCGCTFHDTCLRTALLVRGYNVPECGGMVEFRCPKCNKESNITFTSLP